MPLDVPKLDDRRFQELLDEALARAAVHNPEWTNFQPADPGVTILESFAFLVETLLYRANRIPERDRAKFLTLLGIPLAPARAARTLVAFTMKKEETTPVTLAAGATLAAGPVPFFTEAALDVLPGESRVVVKRVAAVGAAREADYRVIYKSLLDANPGSEPVYYEPTPLPPGGLDLAQTADRAVWIALLAPAGVALDAAREAWAGKTLGLGLAPRPEALRRATFPPAGRPHAPRGQSGGWEVALASGRGEPTFRTLRLIRAAELYDEPAAYEIPLPADLKGLTPPEPDDAFDEGSGAFPPTLDAAKDTERLAVWLRLNPKGAAFAGVRWAGVNAVSARQSLAIRGESIGTGSGETDQEFQLSHGPVVPGSVRVRVRGALPGAAGPWEEWAEIDDLLAAGPQTARGAADAGAPSRVFQSDPESLAIRFGDGLRGARPADGAPIRADYEVSMGRAGNVGAGQLKATGNVPAGIDATNPLPARGGGDAQTPDDADALIPRAVRHRDRLVTSEDYRDLALAAPGAGVGRVEVLPLYAPTLGASLPGDVAGAVTLLLVPRDDPARPDAPTPTTAFLDAVCAHLDSRRVVTAEVYLRGPDYVSLTVSVGFEVQAGFAAPDVRDRLAAAVRSFLSPLPAGQPDAANPDGWPLEKPVNSRELVAVAGRVRGVRSITGIEIAAEDKPAASEIPMFGLKLPRLDRLSVTLGTPVPVGSLRGQVAPPSPTGPKPLPVPVIPSEC